MKQFFRKTLSLVLAAALTCSLSLTALASDAMGNDLSSRDTVLNQETQLSTNVFWSTAYSDLRTENLVTYTPNSAVTPMVTYGNVLTDRSTVSNSAKQLESQGFRVVAGINGDFYNVNSGLPIGLVVARGKLRSSDGGYYAIGFHADGTAVLGKPAVKVSADLGYSVQLEGESTPTEVVRQLTAVNKARVSTGGIYLYTSDFNASHTTGNTEAGVDVLCTIQEGQLSIGGTMTVTVDQVLEAESATPIGSNQVVLSANLKSDSYSVDALRRIPVGSTITLTTTASSESWNGVQYAVGALYSLVENGQVVSGLPKGSNPRTAIGQKPDGTLIFYTVDGRKSGHSIGAAMSQIAARLIELGCTTALCLDGGGSTALSVTKPDQLTAKRVNTPSDGSERAVSNQIFLVASSEPTGQLGHFYVQPEQDYVLAGSRVDISAAALDTHFIPMTGDAYDLQASDGTMDGRTLITPSFGGDVTVTASNGDSQGSAVVHVVETPDSITVRNSTGSVVTGLTLRPGSSAELTASAVYNRMALKADQDAFTWSLDNEAIGQLTEDGVFTAAESGTGTITVTAGGRSTSLQVTVSEASLGALEDFEGTTTIFRGRGANLDFSLVNTPDLVARGRGAAKLDYQLTEEAGFTAQWNAIASTAIDPADTVLHVWVRGDGSSSTLSFLYTDGAADALRLPITALNFTGWKQISVPISGSIALQGLAITGSAAKTGTIYLDHITSGQGEADAEPPVITAELDEELWTVNATVSDASDGILDERAISVTCSGGTDKGTALNFTYDSTSGVLSIPLPGSSTEEHPALRITVTATDGSGNIGRTSVDIEPTVSDHAFTDISDYWAATYVDFLSSTGITTGYDDGTFRPNQNITRAQFAVMLFRYLGLDEAQYSTVQLPFSDAASIPEYALPAIRALYAKGILSAVNEDDGSSCFYPYALLTRAQAATMIGRTQAKGYAAAPLSFSDAASIPAYAAAYIQSMTAQGVISGYADGTFQPAQNITRGQMAKILYTLL